MGVGVGGRGQGSRVGVGLRSGLVVFIPRVSSSTTKGHYQGFVLVLKAYLQDGAREVAVHELLSLRVRVGSEVRAEDLIGARARVRVRERGRGEG